MRLARLIVCLEAWKALFQVCSAASLKNRVWTLSLGKLGPVDTRRSVIVSVDYYIISYYGDMWWHTHFPEQSDWCNNMLICFIIRPQFPQWRCPSDKVAGCTQKNWSGDDTMLVWQTVSKHKPCCYSDTNFIDFFLNKVQRSYALLATVW